MKTSQQGLDLIKEFEGYSPTAYLCPAGKLTIGYGHVVKPGENLKVITKEQGEALLRSDLHDAEQAVIAYVDVAISQNEFDALVSLVFNTGAAPLLNTLGEKLNANDHVGAAKEFNRWIYAGGNASPGLRRRRVAEAALFTGRA